MKAHTFDTQEAAEAAMSVINQGEGIPISPDATTRTYADAIQLGDQWYILADTVTEGYLGPGEYIDFPLAEE